LDAELALAGCLTDQRQLAQLTDASLCHGWAGLLHTTRRVATDSADPDRFDLRQILGRAQQVAQNLATSADDGLLTGAAGTRLATHTATVGTPPLSGWDACLHLDAGRPDLDPQVDTKKITHRALPSREAPPGRTS
jgi:hypothetical protein